MATVSILPGGGYAIASTTAAQSGRSSFESISGKGGTVTGYILRAIFSTFTKVRARAGSTSAITTSGNDGTISIPSFTKGTSPIFNLITVSRDSGFIVSGTITRGRGGRVTGLTIPAIISPVFMMATGSGGRAVIGSLTCTLTTMVTYSPLSAACICSTLVPGLLFISSETRCKLVAPALIESTIAARRVWPNKITGDNMNNSSNRFI